MLARRFVIVCLLVSIFGMALATLVAETSRPANSWEARSVCVFDAGAGCGRRAR